MRKKDSETPRPTLTPRGWGTLVSILHQKLFKWYPLPVRHVNKFRLVGPGHPPPGDRAAWANILTANGGTDQSGGGNLMCVFTQNCAQVHRCTVCRNGRPVQVERPSPLPPVGMVTVGTPPNVRTIYFYNDPLQGWGNPADRLSGCLSPRHPRRRRTH